jgi:DeoR family myo-inositol catabolism operon transcriptional repressor
MFSQGGPILKHKRLNAIVDYLKTHNQATIRELAERFEVSEITIRRDLTILDENGVINKVYGGAVYNFDKIHQKLEIPISKRQAENISAKQKIGELSATLVEDGDTIFVDTGSTVYRMIPHLQRFNNLTIVTNSLDGLLAGSTLSGIRLLTVGGVFQPDTHSFAGSYSEYALDRYSFNKSFISAVSVSPERGVSNNNIYDTAIKRTAIKNSQKSYLVVDGSKFSQDAFNNFAALNEFSGLVTDVDPGDKIEEYCKAQNMLLMYENE